MERCKVDIGTIFKKKQQGQKITMLTAYDAPTARSLDQAGIDIILVGDSAGNVVLGYKDTRAVSMDEMVMLTAAAVRGNETAFVVGDMPFMSYNTSIEDAIRNAGRFVKEAGADAVKLEGAGRMVETVKRITEAGIPVVGHLGLTPQTADMLGGYHVQGGRAESAKKLLEDALELEAAGAIMVVLELVPDRVAKLLSEKLTIPTIGIGAGNGTDGQVLVVHDMLGIKAGFSPKFIKQWANIGEDMVRAATGYREEVEATTFPSEAHTFKMKDDEFEKLTALLAE